MNLAITPSDTLLHEARVDKLKRALGMSPSRSHVLLLLPFLVVLLCMGISFAMMMRYELAIDMNLPGKPLEWAQFHRTNSVLLLTMGASSFIVGLLVVYAVRSSLRSVARSVEQAASGRFDLPVKQVSEREVDQLQGQIRHMLEALNDMVRDSGMGATIIVDLDGKVQLINPLAQLLLRVSPDEVVGHSFVRLFSRSGSADNAQLIDLVQQSLRSQDPLRQRSIQLVIDHGRLTSVKLRTSFFINDGKRQMAINVLEYDLSQVADIRDKIERAARFLTLGSLSAHLAHEIRNPLTSIAGLVELLKSEEPDTRLKLEYIHHIETSADRLNHLIEGLMDFSAIEKCDLTVQPVDDILKQVVGGLRHEPKWQDKTLQLDCDDQLPQVACNNRWLSRALINLLDNACNAVPADGVVTVTARQNDESAIDSCRMPSLDVIVHNTGSYIEPQRRKEVFEPFVTGRSTGTGLGLSIVQQIVRAHGGSIRIDSDQKEGTQFVVRLPLVEDSMKF